MGTYLERLGPEVTMGAVFNDLYFRTDKVIEELKDLRDDKRSTTIPGLPIELSTDTDGAGRRGNRCTTTVIVNDGKDKLSLVGRTRQVISTQSQGVYIPESVQAYRGSEESPDYSVRHESSGMVTSKLGFMGIEGRPSRREPFGAPVSRDLNESLAGLPEAYTEQIELVGSAILCNLDIVENIACGMSVEDAFAEAGREPLRVAA